MAKTLSDLWKSVNETRKLYQLWLKCQIYCLAWKRQVAPERRLLLLSSSLPPAANVGVLRPMGFARYASANGWSMHLAGLRWPAEPSESLIHSSASLPGDVEVIERLHEPYRGATRLCPAIDGDLIHALRLVAACHEMERRPAAVLATGPTFNMFVAGLLLAKKFAVPLVLDYRDEWTTGSLPFVGKGWWNGYFERRCLKAASLVLFTTQSFLDKARQKWPELAGPHWRVLPNGFDPEVVPTERPIARAGPAAAFTFLFPGHLADMLAPEKLAEAIERAAVQDKALLDRVRFRFVGRKSETAMRRLATSPCNGLFELVPPVAHAEIAKEYAAADGLLLVYGPGLEGTRVTKLYEYLPQNRPILYFGPASEASAAVLRTAAGIAVTDGDPRRLRDAIRRCLEAPEGFWDTPERRTWAAQYTRQAVARRLYAMLDELVDRKKIVFTTGGETATIRSARPPARKSSI